MSEQESKPAAGSSGTPEPSAKSKTAKATGGGKSAAGKKDADKAQPPAKGSAGGAAKSAPPPPRRNGRRPGLWLALLALIIALLAVLGAGYLWQQQQQLRSTMQDRLTALQRDDAALRSDWSDRAEQLQQRAERLSQAQQELRDSVESVRELAGRSRRDWMLAEVEYLLRIANRRLQLQRDVGTAMAALSSADARLRELADPGLTDVRQEIARELDALRATERPDIEGMSVQLTSLSEQVDQLPVKAARAPERTPQEVQTDTQPLSAKQWREAAARAWQAIKSLVVIRRRDEPIQPLLGPEQEFAVREGLRLKLESARVALLRQNQDLYRSSLQGAQAWLQRYFIPDDSRSQAMQQTLQQLQSRTIQVALPDISASLRTLRDTMRQRGLDTAPEAAPEATPEPDQHQPTAPGEAETPPSGGAAADPADADTAPAGAPATQPEAKQ